MQQAIIFTWFHFVSLAFNCLKLQIKKQKRKIMYKSFELTMPYNATLDIYKIAITMISEYILEASTVCPTDIGPTS